MPCLGTRIVGWAHDHLYTFLPVAANVRLIKTLGNSIELIIRI